MPDPGLELAEVQRVLEDIPKQWYQHLSISQIQTTDELMCIMKFQELELTATEDMNIYKLAKQVAKINLECPPGRTPFVRAHLSSSSEYTYPRDNFKSRRKPLRACRHCSSDYHWDNDCPPHRSN